MPQPSPDPTSYHWLEESTSYASAGCITVVTGLQPRAALTVVGAEPDQTLAARDIQPEQGMTFIAVAGTDVGLPEGAVVLVEDNGWEGIRPEVLAAWSKRGKAASVFWNVNGVVRFACARRGKVLASLELPPDDETDELPATLRRVWERSDEASGPVAVGMAMVEKFTGVPVPEVPDIAQPSTAYAITSPVLGLRVTTEELLGLQYPSPAVVAAVQAAAPGQRRALAEWATQHALANASIADEPQLQSVLAQMGSGTAVRLTAEASAYRREADRWSMAATWAYSVEDDRARYEELRHWEGRHWAMEALAYTAEPDDVTAALGATYCASIPYPQGGENYQQFLAEAVKQVNQ